jgi:hypothetical protein
MSLQSIKGPYYMSFEWSFKLKEAGEIGLSTADKQFHDPAGFGTAVVPINHDEVEAIGE